MQKSYQHLCSLSKKSTLLDGITGLLSWDQETYMPKQASAIRAEQIALLAEQSHALHTGKEFEKTLQTLIDIPTGKIHDTTTDQNRRAILTLSRKDFIREKKLTPSFVQEFARVTSEALFLWQQAKSKNDFKSFQKTLEHIVSLVRKKADLVGYDKHPYDALLDEFEPEATVADIDKLFLPVKKASQEIAKAKRKRVESIPIPATDHQQMQICRWILDLIGFDFSKGRIDVSAHPFSSSYHPTDTRLTTRMESHGIAIQILTTLHEAGHSFYDMGLPVEYFGTPLCRAVSYGIHESQSRFWETRIGRSLPFIKLILPTLQKKFPKALQGVTPKAFYESLNQVAPSYIRVDADEVTYPLHVILRYEIEKELLTGTLKVRELPERWSAGMKELLGLEPPNDALGCLQDIHWSMGAFGYFPSYLLGNIYAALLFEAFEQAHPDWSQRIQKADFGFIHTWLREKIWRHGRRYSPKELITKATKKTPRADAFIDYLKGKY